MKGWERTRRSGGGGAWRRVRAAVLGGLVLGSGVGLLSAAAPAEDYECLIEPHVTVDVSSAIPGILGSVGARRGDTVRKGQVVARLKSGVEEAAFANAKARSDFTARRVARNEDLYKRELISIHEKDEMETEKRIAEIDLRQAREVLKQRSIKSPIHGVVVERHFDPGEFVSEAAVLTVAQIHPLNVEVIVPFARLREIEAGDTALVRPVEPFGEPREAKVVIVDRVVDASSGTIGVRLEMPNPRHETPAGIKCRVEFLPEP